MEAGTMNPDTVRDRHEERLARSLRVFSALDPAGPRRLRLRPEPCPLEALARRLFARRTPAAPLAG